MVNYQSIDRRIIPLCKDLQERGIPLHKETAIYSINFRKRELARIKQNINRSAGFMVNLSDDEDWIRAVESQGVLITKRERTSLIEMRREFPLIQNMVDGSILESQIKALCRIAQIAYSYHLINEGFRIFPQYFMDEGGEICTAGEIDLRSARSLIQDFVYLDKYVLLEATYLSLELCVLHAMSGDPVLGDDLRGDPYESLAKRLFRTDDVDDEKRSVAKEVHYVTACGGGSRLLADRVNKFYEGSCSQTSPMKRMNVEQAEVLQMRWRNIYCTASEFMSQLATARDQSTSLYGRSVSIPDRPSRKFSYTEDATYADRFAVHAAIRMTSVDLAKLGFATVFEDPRVQALGGQILTVSRDSLLMAVPFTSDGPTMMNVLKEDLMSADTRFQPKIDISWGVSWGKIGRES
jgi:hypothetical protein